MHAKLSTAKVMDVLSVGFILMLALLLFLSLFLTSFTQPPRHTDQASDFVINADNFSDQPCGSSTCDRTHTAMFSLVAPAIVRSRFGVVVGASVY